jgi:Leucine-rich repeat (LRR) protein
MRNLKELNLAKNLISKIDNSLNSLKSLESVNLSGNLIYSFDDLLSLQNLPYLRIVSFKDPQYGSCPITNLCNYTVFMIYHLPELITLDTVPINQKPLKEITDVKNRFHTNYKNN